MRATLRAMVRGVCVIGLVALLTPATGRAAIFEFTGTLVASDPHSFGGMLTGPLGPFPPSTVSGSFTFNDATPDANPSPTIGQYNGAIQSLSLSVTSIYSPGVPYQFGFNAAGPLNSIAVNSSTTVANQSYVVSASMQHLLPPGPIVDGDDYFLRDFHINLTRPTSSVFTSDALPQTPPSLAPFSLYHLVNNPNGQFRLVFASGHGDHTLIGNLTSLTLVPVPAAAYLFGSGLIGLIGLARRKTHRAV